VSVDTVRISLSRSTRSSSVGSSTVPLTAVCVGSTGRHLSSQRGARMCEYVGRASLQDGYTSAALGEDVVHILAEDLDACHDDCRQDDADVPILGDC